MNPATPPRSRYSHSDTDTESASSHLQTPQLARTPNKGSMRSAAPVTPSTARKTQGTRLQFKSGPFLQPPGTSASLTSPGTSTSLTSPFNGMKSPEYTPMRRASITSQPLHSVSRVLFPQSDSDAKRVKTGDVRLLPPQPTTPRPSTPSDRVTDFGIAQQWHNPDISTHSDEEEEEVRDTPLPNPFVSTDVPSKETRVQRRMELLAEQPDLGTHITYVDKRGEPARRRRLSQRAQKVRPRMLFEQQLYAEHRSDQEDAGDAEDA